MAQGRPSSAIVPLDGVEPAEAIELDLTGHICVAEYVVAGHVQLLTTLALVAEEHHSGPLDVVVVLEVKLELHLPDTVFKAVDAVTNG